MIPYWGCIKDDGKDNGNFIAAPKISTCWAIFHVQASYVSCGVAEASDVSFSLALLAVSPLRRFKFIIL